MSKKLKTAALVLGCAMVLFSPVRAAARDYVFTVTVDVRNLHPTVTRGEVSCSLRNAAGTSLGAIVNTPFTLAAGTFRGDVEGRIALRVGGGTPASWLCSLRFYPPGAASPVGASALSEPTHPLHRAEFDRAPGSPFVHEITGSF
jgi:hypothetical protein